MILSSSPTMKLQWRAKRTRTVKGATMIRGQLRTPSPSCRRWVHISTAMSPVHRNPARPVLQVTIRFNPHQQLQIMPSATPKGAKLLCHILQVMTPPLSRACKMVFLTRSMGQEPTCKKGRRVPRASPRANLPRHNNSIRLRKTTTPLLPYLLPPSHPRKAGSSLDSPAHQRQVIGPLRPGQSTLSPSFDLPRPALLSSPSRQPRLRSWLGMACILPRHPRTAF
ncbi:hypothetical protein F5883DRAFT_543515 [Diaporthe sp. PMI_573]|nr:hypothetical protein F5883DRAFT_543515 [Diaporthaceae sp. PMI_573]